MVRRWARASRLTRCIAFLAATAFLLPFTILLLVADQQFKLAYNTKRVFYQENNELLIRFNTSRTAAVNMAPTPSSQYALENYTRGDEEERLSPARYAEVGARMDLRRAHLERECHKAGLDGPENTPYTWEYLINKQYHVIWCNIFKAASSSWMYNFNLMANYSASFLDKTKEVPLELARKRYSRPTVDMVRAEQKHAVTFLIVRHPLERLASAYKDKIVHAFPRSFHAKMGDRIIRTYRKDTGNGEKWPSFQEFISYLLDEIRGQRPLDMHWTPYTAFCTPCQFHFDAILKFETLDDDQKYLIQKAKLQDIIKPEWRNRGKGKDTLSKINSYYSMITRNQLDMLYDFYRHDFQLFNYTIDSYYDIVQDG